MDNQSRLFAVVPPAPSRQFTVKEKERGPEMSPQSHGQREREVHITGTAEVCCPADRVSVRFRLGSSKESVSEATTSVARRLDYILHSVRQHGVSDKDASVRKFLQREGEQYRMDAEVLVNFSDFEIMERVCSLLLEKLDRSVCVGTPEFYHSTECLGQMRQRACAAAVENAHQKARDISELLGHTLGPPQLVREEEAKEWRNEHEEEGRSQRVAPLPHHTCMPTVAVSSRVSVSFSLRDSSRKKL
ncbi:interleukin-1 receptor-associated kinase 1-binding protein 1 homolog [Takifugu rubripes]|uniref:Interleukin-1 receptor-associated kinase 1 binding protein 1 n=1 Tax=Takifugu rubripes TaxID=31033 RepID=H2RSG5_TAKRU|nr:interleukin-1 receptor-associated kinase 1-binding protein 1 [Takifugu rubripes]|eukprot:XP_003976197.2 PREDICTED: interleukin-1 receptor-associated kinase 1-binding protein 1 [Takifugu rubripes]